ncbi:hypothetical protein B0H66DRAFT_186017 [Apodospora peruviana]|uniref:Uncharacterized protein n=1 Tax=Apodospora peruviana TaxID=516989 RepID=A0AAE0M778_9PEZI|nr:hypothetical protein B0H66DRAFT_186017 [Apodospora peruviana]
MATTQDSPFTGWRSPLFCDRSTLDLLYGCGATIFLCCWTAVHLNVPADDEGPLSRTLRKVKCMLICLVAPESIAWCAVDELWGARIYVKDKNKADGVVKTLAVVQILRFALGLLGRACWAGP